MLLAAILALSMPAEAAPAPSTALTPEQATAKIKSYRFEVRPIEYKGQTGVDPFRPGVPMRAGTESKNWKVRIKTLKLSSVIVGRQRVAVFKESIGPTYSYVLVNGVLVGPDHKPIPGIEGSIEETGRRGDYRVTLRQGVETIVHTLADEEAKSRRAYGTAGSASSGTEKSGTQPEESE